MQKSKVRNQQKYIISIKIKGLDQKGGVDFILKDLLRDQNKKWEKD